MTEVEIQTLRRKYAEERAKRLRPDGNDQYLELHGQFEDLLQDPYTERVEREPKRDHVTVAFVGGGFAGLVTGARLKEAGIDDVRIVEKGGDFGGTWYWNRYPGAQCDTASMIYLPLLEETGHMPTEQYVHAPEILEHCHRIAKQYGLYENALFHTRVTGLEWDESRGWWIVRTDRGDEFTAQFVGWGTGPLHVAEAARHPRHREFRGPRVPHQPLGLRLYRRRSGRSADGPAGRQAGRHHRHRCDIRAMRPASGGRMPGAVRLPADAVIGRHARQPARSTRSGSPTWPLPAGSSAGCRTSSPT